jgi:pyrimidine-nucleoside phosphorylase
MEQPLGCAVGNALEVREAIDTLRGHGPDDFTEHCLVVAAEMVLLADRCSTTGEGRAILLGAIESGKAIAKFREWMRAQDGNDAVLDDVALMPQASLVADLPSPQNGHIAAVNAMEVGLATVGLGAGRQKKGEPIDHAVGVVLAKKVGDYVEEGESLLTIHANAEQQLAEARGRLLSAYRWSDTPVEAPPLIRRIIH